MKIKTLPGTDQANKSKWMGYLLLLPGMLYDLAYLLLRPLLTYAAPVAFAGIGLILLFGFFLDMDKQAAGVSNTVAIFWITLSALGFSWASAIGQDHKDFRFIMELSKRFMRAAIALILATGFKFALLHMPHGLGLPVLGGAFRIFLTVIMACYFGQSMLEAFLPLLQLNAYLSREVAYLPGLTLLNEHLPRTSHKLKAWLQSVKREGTGGRAGAGAPA